MHQGHRRIALPITFVYAGLALSLACAPRRYYDPYYSDYHAWNRPEVGFYAQWEVESKRPHQDFDKRSANEQREYFSWRHSHDQDHDQKKDNHDKDHDKDHNNH